MFRNVILTDISTEPANFESTRDEFFGKEEDDGTVSTIKQRTIKTVTTEKYKRFEVTWECSE